MKSVPTRSFLTGAALLTLGAIASAVFDTALLLVVVADMLFLAAVVVDFLRTPALKKITVQAACPALVPLGRPFSLDLSCRAAFPLKLHLAPELPNSWSTAAVFQDIALQADRKGTTAFECVPDRRGHFQVTDVTGSVYSPLGLWRRQVVFHTAAGVDVVPDAKAVPGRTAYFSRSKNRLSGSVRNRLAGHGLELAYLRESLPDDDPRLIDWCATMRSGRMVSRVFEREAESQVVLAVDCGRSMLMRDGGYNLLDHVLNAVLAFSSLLIGRKEHLTIIPFAGTVGRAIRTTAMQRVARSLSGLEPQPEEPDFRSLFEYLRTTQRKSGLFYLITGSTGQFRERFFTNGLKQLVRKHRTTVMIVKDPGMDSVLEAAHGDQWERAVAMDWCLEREAELVHLRKTGGRFLDIGYRKLGGNLIASYLKLKERGY